MNILRSLRVGSLLGFVVAVGLFAGSVQAQVGGGTPMYFNGFEGAETITITDDGGSVTNIVGVGDTPDSSRIRTGTFSWQLNNGSNTLTSASVPIGTAVISSPSNQQVIVRAASISTTTGNGIDATDFIEIHVALDGADFSGAPAIKLNGPSGSNARWGFDATNELQGFVGEVIDVDAPQSGTSDNNYANLGVDIPNSATSVAVKVVAKNNSSGEIWCLDDIEIQSAVPGWTQPAAPNTNVTFSIAADAVGEASGVYTVTVTKSLSVGNISGQVEISGDATEGGGNDFTVNTTNFTMNGATTTAEIEITINDDGDPEGFETVVLTLVNVEGGTIDSPSVFTLTIADNDTLSSLIISQYTETDSGTTPKGIEVWNVSGSDITFDDSGNQLVVWKGANGAALAVDATISTGTVVAGDVFVIGTSDMSPDFEKAFTFNGDDALQITLGGVVQDTFGDPGTGDPGAGWAGNGVQTYDQNIEIQDGITNGDLDGWTDPSTRYTNIAVGSDITGFGVAPGASPPTNVAFSAAADAVNENVGVYTVTVTKSVSAGNVTGEVELGGDATEGGGADYTVNVTNFTMNGATVTADIEITINDDSDNEGSETITLTLANVDGGTIASPSVFTLTINPSDIPAEGIADFRFNVDPYVNVSAQAGNITVSNMTLTSGSIDVNQTSGAYFPDEPYIGETGGWTEDNQAAAKAFTFTIVPDSGYKVSITGISFSAYATGTGPSGYGYDINGGAATFADDMPDSSIVHVTNAVTGVDDVTAPIDILIQAWTNGSRVTSGTGTFRIDDVVIFGVVELVGGGGDTTLDEYDATGITEAGGSFTITIDVSSNGVPYSLIYTTDILTDGDPSGTGVADTQNGDGGSITLEDTTPGDDNRLYWIRSNN